MLTSRSEPGSDSRTFFRFRRLDHGRRTTRAEAEWAVLASRLESTLLAQSTLWLAATLLGSWLVVRVSLIFSGFEH